MSFDLIYEAAFIGFLVLAGAAFVGFVVYLFRLDRPQRPRPKFPPLQLPDVGAFVMTPVEAGMTPAEREAFRSWLDGRWPQPPGGEEITR